MNGRETYMSRTGMKGQVTFMSPGRNEWISNLTEPGQE